MTSNTVSHLGIKYNSLTQSLQWTWGSLTVQRVADVHISGSFSTTQLVSRCENEVRGVDFKIIQRVSCYVDAKSTKGCIVRG
jgi:hypothetical protein